MAGSGVIFVSLEGDDGSSALSSDWVMDRWSKAPDDVRAYASPDRRCLVRWEAKQRGYLIAFFSLAHCCGSKNGILGRHQ
jgi:hypothetical protein